MPTLIRQCPQRIFNFNSLFAFSFTMINIWVVSDYGHKLDTGLTFVGSVHQLVLRHGRQTPEWKACVHDITMSFAIRQLWSSLYCPRHCACFCSQLAVQRGPFSRRLELPDCMDRRSAPSGLTRGNGIHSTNCGCAVSLDLGFCASKVQTLCHMAARLVDLAGLRVSAVRHRESQCLHIAEHW